MQINADLSLSLCESDPPPSAHIHGPKVLDLKVPVLCQGPTSSKVTDYNFFLQLV